MKKRIICVLLAVFCVLCSSSCSNSKLKALDELMGEHGGVSYKLANDAEKYNFTSDIFTETTESGVHANVKAIVGGKVVSADEIEVSMQMPMTETIPAEESESGEIEERTVYYPVTAYIRLLTFKPSKVYYDADKGIKANNDIRILMRVSSRMWDSEAIPLFEGDECVLYLESSEAENDIMKIQKLGFADYILYDSRNGVIKKTKDGYIFSDVQEFLSRSGEKISASESDYEKLSENEKKCYKDASDYVRVMKKMYFAKSVEDGIKNNVEFYLEH